MPARLRVLSRERTGHARPISHRIIPTTLFIQANITMVTKIVSVKTVTIIRMKYVRQRAENSGDVGNLSILAMLGCLAGSCVCQKRSFGNMEDYGATTR